MFVDKKDILSQLAAGMDPESIAQNLIDTLNEAIADYEEDRKQAAARQDQIDSAAILLSAFESYIADYCPNIKAEAAATEEETTPEDIIELMDMLDKAVHSGKEVMTRLESLVDNILEAIAPQTQEATLSAAPGTTPELPSNLIAFLERNKLV